jgi:uncharacterized UPF0160 family protein
MKKVVTHDGSFHSDDVFAVAALQLLFAQEVVEIVRVPKDLSSIEADFVVDVGGVYDHERRRYDHHQPGAPVRENGIPYAAFGLVWRHYGADICGSEAVATKLDTILVQPIDAPDNGMTLSAPLRTDVRPVELYQVVASFAPPWGSDDNKDEAFLAAVDWARSFISRLIRNTHAIVELEVLVREVYEASADKRLLEFLVPVPAEALISYPDVQVIVSPDTREQDASWRATVVKKAYGSFESRVSFPEAWAGLRSTDLQAVSGISDAVFCHKARFLFVARSRESALEAAQLAR